MVTFLKFWSLELAQGSKQAKKLRRPLAEIIVANLVRLRLGSESCQIPAADLSSRLYSEYSIRNTVFPPSSREMTHDADLVHRFQSVHTRRQQTDTTAKQFITGYLLTSF